MKKSLFILLALALLNCGCSMISLVYRNADWYLQHKIDGYTSFNSRQKETIRQEVSDYMSWHRKNALPEYIMFLQNFNGAAQFDGTLRVEAVAMIRTHLFDLYKKTLVPAIRPTARLLSSLDSLQIQELAETFAEENQKKMQEVLDRSPGENLDYRADKTIDFVEWLAGNLGHEQEQQIREMSRHLPVVSHVFLQYREANQGRLIGLLNDHAGEEKIAAFLSAWVNNPEAARTAQQHHAIQSFEIAADEMTAQIQGLLTASQKEHLHEKLSSYIEEMHAESGTSR